MNSLGLKVFVVSQFVCSFISADFQPERDVMFLLRVRDKSFDEEQIYRFHQKEELRNSLFDPSKQTVFVVHGYTEDRTAEHHVKLCETILKNENVNLFFVDWGSGAKTFLYPLARSRVDGVGKVLGEMINYLHKTAGLKYENTTLIGFSLGSHIVGAAGKLYVNQKVRRVLGIDPAGPLFEGPEDRLSPESAIYVECYHTGYIMGIKEPICQADFYFNGGSKQPGCILDSGVDNLICSHGRSIDVLMESLKTPKTFYGLRCEDLKSALLKNCNGQNGAFINDPENESKRATGIFHVTTNKQSPFGRDSTA